MVSFSRKLTNSVAWPRPVGVSSPLPCSAQFTKITVVAAREGVPGSGGLAHKASDIRMVLNMAEDLVYKRLYIQVCDLVNKMLKQRAISCKRDLCGLNVIGKLVKLSGYPVRYVTEGAGYGANWQNWTSRRDEISKLKTNQWSVCYATHHNPVAVITHLSYL